MPTTYAGNGTVPSATKPWTRVAITAVSNATPIQITAPSHGFNTGDTVYQEGNDIAGANGLFQITKVDANNYKLNGTTAGGAGASFGYAIDMQVQPAISLPSSLEDVSASTSNPPVESAANFQPFMYMRGGQYSLFGMYRIPVGTLLGSTWSTTTLSSTAFALLTSTTFTLPGTLGFDPIFQASDIVEIDWQVSLDVAVAGSPGNVYVGMAGILGAGTPGSLSGWETTQSNTPTTAGSAAFYRTVDLRVVQPGSAFPGSAPGRLTLAIAGALAAGVGNTNVTLVGSSNVQIKHWRPN